MHQSNVLLFTRPKVEEREPPEEECLSQLKRIALGEWIHHSMPWHLNPIAATQAAIGYTAQSIWQWKQLRPYFWFGESLMRTMRRAA
jgi:hypothetical protein